MGRIKKGFNWKARQQTQVTIDNSQLSNIKLSVDLKPEASHDEANAIVLPSSKRPTAKVKDKTQHIKLLSKKQRKRLEKIVENKKKKAQSNDILEALEKVQAPIEIFNQFTSISDARTHGKKRKRAKDERLSFISDEIQDQDQINSVAKSKRQRRILTAVLNKEKNLENRSDIVGLNVLSSSSSSSSSSESFEDEIVENNEELNKKILPVVEVKEEPIEMGEYKERNIEVKSGETKMKSVSSGKDNSTVPTKKTIWVPVNRVPEIQEARLKLPILAEEQYIMEVINDNDVVIIAGETGSGKTTQIPQFLYETGYTQDGKIIGITQPRRVAAITMSKRVAEEMNISRDFVSYLIRFEGNVTDKTCIKFMTDGVLLKEIQTDFLLTKYSVIVLDEAHERNTYTDILIGLLSRIVPLRNKKGMPMKLIIMSATLRIEDFTENQRLFKSSPPVVKVESRQYPVTIHFSKTTPDDYVKEAYLKVCKIHGQLPEGGILIFVTGQQEVHTLVKKLRRRFPLKQTNKEENFEELNKKKFSRRKPKPVILPKIDLDKYSVIPPDDTELDLINSEISSEEETEEDSFSAPSCLPLYTLPFYSLLPADKQSRVFEMPPPNARLCVVATNVAETSLTIPNIKYVVDTGRTKIRVFDQMTGVGRFLVGWCSKAAANQRAGRAGRMGEGHCYRLYSSAIYNDQFQQFSTPEIQQKPVDALLLQMKAMNIVKVVNFPFPTSPDLLQLSSAEKRLRILGALTKAPLKKGEYSAKLTPLGETMSVFPVAPRYGKMLALSTQRGLLQYVLAIVAALSVPEVLAERDGDKKWAAMRKVWAGSGNSFLLGDVMVLLRAVGAAECSKDSLEAFCNKNGLRHKAIIEIRKLRVQLTNQINMMIPDLNLAVDRNMRPPTDDQARLLRQILLAGMADQVAHRLDPCEVKDNEDKNRSKRAYKCCEMEETVYLKVQSVLSGKDPPEWIVYQEVFETNRLYFRGVTAIEPEWLPLFCPALCNLSDPLDAPPPRYDCSTGKVHCFINGTFGKAAFPLPTMEIPYTTSIMSYKLFAKFLLLGEVFPKLRKFTTSLLSAPSSLTKPWAKLQPRTELLIKSLTSKEANTREKLVDIWKEDTTYLLSAYQSWLPESAHAELIRNWPPL